MSINRRKFLIIAGGVGVALAGGLWLSSKKRTNYLEAYKDNSKRDAWLQGLE